MWKQRIKHSERVGLELSPAERKLLLTGVVFLHDDVEAAIRAMPPGGEVMLTLSDLEDLVGHVAGEANHAKTERIERILSDIFEKIENLLDHYEEERLPSKPVKQPTPVPDALPTTVNPVILQIPRRAGDEQRRYSLKITPLQRKSLLLTTSLSDDLEHRIEQLTEGVQDLDVTRDELDELYDKIGDALASARTPHKARLMSLSRKIEAHFEREVDEAFGGTSV